MRARPILAGLLLALAAPGARAAGPVPPAPPTLDLRALYVEHGGRAAVAPEVEALRGREVRVRGFMVQMEEAPEGAFYLAARPAECDESGGGTADVPVESVLVQVPELAGHEIPWHPGPVELVGRLEVGREEGADGRASVLRVILEEPAAG